MESRVAARAPSFICESPTMVDEPPPHTTCEEKSTEHSFFSEFMTKVALYGELVDAGNRFLVRFRRELECFRRPQISKGSDVVSEILGSNCTERMKSYLQAGCSLHCQNILNLNQLHSCERELKDHMNKVKALLKELHCLVEDAYDTILAASLSALKVRDNPAVDNEMINESCFMEEKEQPADQVDSDASLVTVMILVHNMLKLDCIMQEKIVAALSLKSSSAELEGYCLMWELRPYVDGNVMNLAWKLCP